jgi:hypothetical protein
MKPVISTRLSLSKGGGGWRKAFKNCLTNSLDLNSDLTSDLISPLLRKH